MNHVRTLGHGLFRSTAIALLSLATAAGLTACSLFEPTAPGASDTTAGDAIEENNATEASENKSSSMSDGTTSTTAPTDDARASKENDEYFIDIAIEYLTAEQDYILNDTSKDALRELMCDEGLTQIMFDFDIISGIEAPDPDDPSSAFKDGDVSRAAIDDQEIISVYGKSLENKRFRLDLKAEPNRAAPPDRHYCVENIEYVAPTETSPSHLPPAGNG
ncbi:hypothetical protein ACEE18_01420 [Corynebacterium freneyi]